MADDPWDRPSLDFNVRPDKDLRDVMQKDLLIPIRGDWGWSRLLLVCLACGAMVSLLLVWTTLMALAILGYGAGRWFYPIVVGVALAVGAALFALAVWDSERQRRWAAEV